MRLSILHNGLFVFPYLFGYYFNIYIDLLEIYIGISNKTIDIGSINMQKPCVYLDLDLS